MGRSGVISPHPWGWPASPRKSNDPQSDFPTPVGMARKNRGRRNHANRFPHTRGDGPDSDLTAFYLLAISPHPWGWPDLFRPPRRRLLDFPTPVGMARAQGDVHSDRGGFPHTRGDGPAGNWRRSRANGISPHPWGWPGLRL